MVESAYDVMLSHYNTMSRIHLSRPSSPYPKHFTRHPSSEYEHIFSGRAKGCVTHFNKQLYKANAKRLIINICSYTFSTA